MLIGISGLAGAGKSTAAFHLEREHGFWRYKMSGPLKNMLRALGLREDQIEGERKETPAMFLSGRTPRYAMQTLGAEWGRKIMGDGQRLANGVCVSIEDIRFPNEAQLVRDMGGIVVRVEGKPPILHQEAAHISEGQTFPVDVIIQNRGTIGDLMMQFDLLIPRYDDIVARRDAAKTSLASDAATCDDSDQDRVMFDVRSSPTRPPEKSGGPFLVEGVS